MRGQKEVLRKREGDPGERRHRDRNEGFDGVMGSVDAAHGGIVEPEDPRRESSQRHTRRAAFAETDKTQQDSQRPRDNQLVRKGTPFCL